MFYIYSCIQVKNYGVILMCVENRKFVLNELFLPESCEDLSPEDSSSDRLSFYHFDISRLLKHGASLLGSAGAEFELQEDKTG